MTITIELEQEDLQLIIELVFRPLHEMNSSLKRIADEMSTLGKE